MIRANLPLFAIIVVLIVGCVWAVFTVRYSDLIASKDGQIQLQDRQLSDYREKLKGASPDEAKARIDALEARLSAIAPRRLTKEQKDTIAKLIPAPGHQIAIVAEGTGDCVQYAADFESVFRAAGWQVTTAQVLGLVHPTAGLALRVRDMSNIPKDANIIADAFRQAGLVFNVGTGVGSPTAAFEILITTKISE